MLKCFAPKFPLRTPLSDYTTILLDSGRSKIIFHKPVIPPKSNKPCPIPLHLVTNHLPPSPSPPFDPTASNSSLCPPFHIHTREDEKFHVISGTTKFLLLDRHFQQPKSSNDASSSTKNSVTAHLADAGTTITIPQGQIHTFRNASITQPLHIEFGFSSPALVSSNHASTAVRHEEEKQELNIKMHRFFLNTQLYRSDCTTQNIPRSLLQILLFNYYADVALVPSWLLSIHNRFPLLRSLIERFIAPTLGRSMNLLGGIVLGKWLFGLRESYKEYYPYDTANIPQSSTSQAITERKEHRTKSDLPLWADRVEKGDAAKKPSKDESAEDLKRKQQDNPWACQAWRDHSFDGQSEDWRK